MTSLEPSADLESLESLEQERDFLLRSLRDLDAEYEAGDIDEADYRNLTDDYTSRTARVLRAIEAAANPGRRPPSGSKRPTAETEQPAGTEQPRAATAATAATATAATATAATATATARRNGSRPDTSGSLAQALQSRRRWRRAAAVTVIAGFGAVTAWAISSSTGSRTAGQTATGNRQLTPPTITGGIDPRFVQASDLVNQGKVTEALKVYDAILKDDPGQPVALANDGWLLAQAGLAANRSDLVDLGLAKIVLAEKNNNAYAAAHFFHGYLLMKAKNDPVGAVTELRIYLGSVDPSSPEVPMVTQLLNQAIQAAGPNVPPGPNAPTTIAPTGPPAP